MREIIRVKAGAIHLKLTDDGEFLFESGSEQFADDLDRVYPLLEKGRADQLEQGLVPDSEEWQKQFRKAVTQERNRSLVSHGLDTFGLVYGDDRRRGQQQALREPGLRSEEKDRIMEELESRPCQPRKKKNLRFSAKAQIASRASVMGRPFSASRI